MSRIAATFRSLYAEILKFGVVGAVGVLTDFVSSNLLWKLTGLDHAVAGVFGTCAATVTAYVGNRFWTFRDRPDEDRRREMALFLLFSLIGMVIENGSVYVTDHIFGWHGQLAANAAKYGFGLPVAGAFRFWSFHVFVFPATRSAAEAAPLAESGFEPSVAGVEADHVAANGA